MVVSENEQEYNFFFTPSIRFLDHICNIFDNCKNLHVRSVIKEKSTIFTTTDETFNITEEKFIVFPQEFKFAICYVRSKIRYFIQLRVFQAVVHTPVDGARTP